MAFKEANDVGHALATLQVGKHMRTGLAHTRRIAIHHIKIHLDIGRQVFLVDDQ